MAATARRAPIAFGLLLLQLKLGYTAASRFNRSKLYDVLNLGRHAKYDFWDINQLYHVPLHGKHKPHSRHFIDPIAGKHKLHSRHSIDPFGGKHKVHSSHSIDPIGIEHLNRTLYNILGSARINFKQGRKPDDALTNTVKLLDSMTLDLLGRLQSVSQDQQKQIDKECSSVKVCDREFQAAKEVVAQRKMAFKSFATEHTTCRTEEVKAKTAVIQCNAMVFVSKQLSESACNALNDFEDSAGDEEAHLQVVNRAPGESVKDYLNRMTTHFCGDENRRGREGEDCDGMLCRWNNKDEECNSAKVNLTSETAQCNQKTESYNDRKISCNRVQKQMDSTMCKHALFSEQACNNYKKCHVKAKKPYLLMKADARENEEGRKKEWKILMHMRCMLKVLLEHKCKPDEKALATCKNRPNDHHNPKHLDLKFTCNLEAKRCMKADLYPGSDEYKNMLANLPKDAPAQDPIGCEGVGAEASVEEIIKRENYGVSDMIGDKNRGLTEEVFLFPQTCDYPDLLARRPTIVRRISSLKFPPWPDLNKDAFAARFTGWIRIRKPGVYKFWVDSRAGSRVYIDEEKVFEVAFCREGAGEGIVGQIHPGTGEKICHPEMFKWGSPTVSQCWPKKINLKEAFAKLRVEVHATMRPAKLVLRYQGPDTFGAATDVPSDVLKKLAPSPLLIRARRNGYKKLEKLPEATGTCTCDFTVHKHLYSVYVDGIDLISKVEGNPDTWEEKKTLRFPCGPSTLLAVSGADSGEGCETGGFAMMCTSTDHQSPWNKYLADSTWKVFSSECAHGRCTADNKRILNMPQGWYLQAFDDTQWPHAAKGETNRAQEVVGTPFDICGRNGPAWLFRSNIQAAL